MYAACQSLDSFGTDDSRVSSKTQLQERKAQNYVQEERLSLFCHAHIVHCIKFKHILLAEPLYIVLSRCCLQHVL